MEIHIIRSRINQTRLKELVDLNYGTMIKGVIDLQRRLLALGGSLHSDAESVLLNDGSKQSDLWGFNLYMDRPVKERLAYTSLINIRPAVKNYSTEIQDTNIQRKIESIVNELVE